MAQANRKTSSFKIILIFVFLTLIGLALTVKLSVRLQPSTTLPQISVSYNMYGSSPLVTEKEVTSKLESLLSRMSGLRNINSQSGNGWGRIQLSFDKHTNISAARFEVSSIIRQAWPQLPNQLSYPQITLQSTNDENPRSFLSYTITAPQSSVEIQQYVENNIKPALSSINGVYQINVSGAQPMEWQLEFDTEQLNKLGISINDIQSSINQHIKNESIGLAAYTATDNGDKFIRVAVVSEPDADTENALNNIEVKKNGDRIIRIADIIKIRKTEVQPNSYFRINGRSTIYLSITADENANQLELGKEVKAKIDLLRKTFPDGYAIETAYDATEYIKEEINKIFFRTGMTVLILLVFVILVYRNLRYTLLILISLFINIAISIILYYLLKIEIQLYSMAGLSISLTLIIDNIIVMSDQIIHRNNKHAFLAILAATLTTIGSLAIIFFLDEKIRLNLTGFALVIIVNLTVSLLVALFLVPALIEKLQPGNRNKAKHPARTWFKRSLVRFNRFYAGYIKFFSRRKFLLITAVVLLFGIPVFLLPDKIEKEDPLATVYNKTFGSDFYKENLKSFLNKTLGGSWRIFTEKVYSGSYFQDRKGETMLYLSASLPNGSTLDQMNFLIQRMENYIAQFSEVRQFETSIYSANRANITIRFTKKNQLNGFPFNLRTKLISKSLELGGGSWSVYGVGDGFSNDLRESAGSYRIEMLGYNYDDLLHYAERFREKLLEYRRIKEVDISSEFSWYKNDYQEFRFDFNKEIMAKNNIQPYELYNAIKPYFSKNIYVAQVPQQSAERIVLQSEQSADFDIWDMKNISISINNKHFKLGQLAEISKYKAAQEVSKVNQQYRLCIQYEYIGAYEQGQNVMKNSVDEFKNELPIGYTIQTTDNYWRWDENNKSQYWLLAIVFIIIFFCSAILFNSLKQPLYIIFIIPVSFIGIFLSFYWFKLNFDQGGFASFILLSGLTVNSNIYIISEFNNIAKQGRINRLKLYLRAWNAKFRPMILTVISTILGFVPFLIGYHESFWFPLAVGAIGGLVTSVLGIFLILPVIMNLTGEQPKSRKSYFRKLIK